MDFLELNLLNDSFKNLKNYNYSSTTTYYNLSTFEKNLVIQSNTDANRNELNELFLLIWQGIFVFLIFLL
jgi:hypothetical protein